MVGTTVNWYYHKAFVGVVASERKTKLKPWKLYKWTKRRTVDDGCLTGAAFGLAASIPMLLMRRPAIPRWMRCLGMTNIGACAGIVGAHGYLEYTGERQKAYKRLDRRLKLRSLEFWAIFWDKELMARFNPLIQHVIRHNGIWHTYHLSDEAFDNFDAHSRATTKTSNANASAQEPEETPFYSQPYDYLDDLKQIDPEYTLNKMAELEAEQRDLLKEAEYLLFIRAQKEYEYCHAEDLDDDERKRRLHEIQLLQIAYNKARASVTSTDTTLISWRESLKHKALLEARPDGDDAKEAWFPEAKLVNYKTHDPEYVLKEMEKFQESIAAEVRRFEELMKHPGYERSRREKWKRDLEDGRGLLRAVDGLVLELERRKKVLDEDKSSGKVVETDKAEQKAVETVKTIPTEALEEGKEESGKAQQADKPQVDETKTSNPHT